MRNSIRLGTRPTMNRATTRRVRIRAPRMPLRRSKYSLARLRATMNSRVPMARTLVSPRARRAHRLGASIPDGSEAESSL